MAIFVTLTVVTVASNTNFGVKITLEGLAYDVAFAVRQAQVYGIAVQRFGSSDDFSRGYGMHFETNSPTSFQLFADTFQGNGLYDCPDPGNQATCELVQSTTMQGGYSIDNLCVRPSGSPEGTCNDVDELNILFKRPEPDAYIRGDGESPLYELGRITLKSPRNDFADVVVEFSGQISVR